MKNLFTACLLLNFIFVGCNKDDDPANNVTPNDTTANAVDAEFVRLASMGIYANIGFGYIAADSSDDSTIIKYATLMVSDYAGVSNTLHQIALNLNLDAPDYMDSAHVAIRSTLMSLHGYQFDSLYIHTMAADHQTALNMFQSVINSGNSPQLKTFANSKILLIQSHLAKADSIAASY